MLKKHSIKLSIMIVLIMVISVGCNKDISNKDNKIAYISLDAESIYKKTFEELSLGIIFDFNLRLPNANKSWVEIWVEGYSNGEIFDSIPLTELSYGLSPNQIEEGNMGFGIMNLNNDEIQLFLYSQGIKTKPYFIDNDFFIKNGISSWDYAIDSKIVELEPGEEKLLAVYRQSEDQLRTYNFQDLDSINKMINEDKTVLLLKIKVEEVKEKN